MRFMLVVKANGDTEQGVLPSREMMEQMAGFNEEMARAGVLLSAEGLQASAKGARIRFSDGETRVERGPFTPDQGLIAGFWLIQADSLDEAIAWGRRSPNPMGPGHPAEIEVRQIFEAADFPAEIFPPEAVAREQALRESLQPGQPHH